MVQIDERTARCFSMLRSPEFKPLIDFLTARREETLERLCDVTDPNLMVKLTGKAIELKEFLEYVDKAEVLLAKIRR